MRRRRPGTGAVATIVATMTAVHRIFVFGTLQEGHRNFHVNRGTRIGGDWVTAQPHPLYVIGPMRLPWLLNRRSFRRHSRRMHWLSCGLALAGC